MQSLFRNTKSLSYFGKRYISVGQQIPKCDLTIVEKQGGQWVKNVVSSDTVFRNKVVLVGYPGAFTPSCTTQHIPEYIKESNQLNQGGVSKVYALAVNDVFVVTEFAQTLGGDGSVAYIADGSGTFTKQLDAGCDLSAKGLGFRTRRFSALVENGKITTVNDEKGPGMTDLSRVSNILGQLKK
eukprot:TRINITY_DN616_c0_g1_i7.p3 TRINITY_DN616_c0_g1~~TRINITY_DN616_c0_g1_i7.p3  ORF type:complete len:183 (+),score=36.13 TRINITY_DN616_c0_g1_i7:206-754(+)